MGELKLARLPDRWRGRWAATKHRPPKQAAGDVRPLPEGREPTGLSRASRRSVQASGPAAPISCRGSPEPPGSARHRRCCQG